MVFDDLHYLICFEVHCRISLQLLFAYCSESIQVGRVYNIYGKNPEKTSVSFTLQSEMNSNSFPGYSASMLLFYVLVYLYP